MRLLAVAVLVAACSTPRPPPLIANRAPPTARPTCDVPAITSALRERWRLEDLELDCTPGRFPAPGFFIEARAQGRRITGVLDAATLREVVTFVDEYTHPAISTIQRATADLDGDGVDEIVETWRNSAHARNGVGNRVVVRRLDEDRRLEIIDGPHVGVFHPDLGGCHAEARIFDGGFVVHVQRVVGIPPSDCLSPGLHRFVLDGSTVVQTRRP